MKTFEIENRNQYVQERIKDVRSNLTIGICMYRKSCIVPRSLRAHHYSIELSNLRNKCFCSYRSLFALRRLVS